MVLHSSELARVLLPLSATTSSTPHSAPFSAPPSAPPVEQRVAFIGALAVAEWATDTSINEASYEQIKEFVKLTFAASDELDYTQFY